MHSDEWTVSIYGIKRTEYYICEINKYCRYYVICGKDVIYIYMMDTNKTIIGIDTRTMETPMACSPTIMGYVESIYWEYSWYKQPDDI